LERIARPERSRPNLKEENIMKTLRKLLVSLFSIFYADGKEPSNTELVLFVFSLALILFALSLL